MRTYDELVAIMDKNPTMFEGLVVGGEEKFRTWLPKNMHVYKAFVYYALILKKHFNAKRYSSRAIWQRLRWDSMISDSSTRFKLANENSPFIARLTMLAEPEMAGMFGTRKSWRKKRA